MDEESLRRIRLATIRLARRHGVRASERDDLAQDAFVHILERSLDPLAAQAAKNSALRTALNDFVIAWLRTQIGRWRPSAMARALGATAIDLERLVVRDGWTRPDATEAILASSAGRLRREAVEGIADALRLVPRAHTVRLPEHPGMSVSSRTPETEAIASHARAVLASALETALRDCSRVDRAILALKFARGLSMAAIEKRLGMTVGHPQKRYERLRQKLLARLTAQGCSIADVHAALDGPGLDPGLLDRLLLELQVDLWAQREREREACRGAHALAMKYDPAREAEPPHAHDDTLRRRARRGRSARNDSSRH